MNDIDNILEKYFDGESSVEEEQSLIHYFQSESVSEEHVKYVPIFQHFAKEKEVNKSVKRTETFKLTRLYLAIASCAAALSPARHAALNFFTAVRTVLLA